jgi:hypothetical protein
MPGRAKILNSAQLVGWENTHRQRFVSRVQKDKSVQTVLPKMVVEHVLKEHFPSKMEKKNVPIAQPIGTNHRIQ